MLDRLTPSHPSGTAKVNERAEEQLTQLEEQLSADDLAEIRHRSQQSDLDILTAQLVIDLAI